MARQVLQPSKSCALPLESAAHTMLAVQQLMILCRSRAAHQGWTLCWTQRMAVRCMWRSRA